MAPTPIQNRKYLCQAPKPEIWDEIRDNVIQNLGNNPEEKIKITLQFIEETHSVQFRIGPGRKSNAEHATHFYQYLLDYIQSQKKKNKDDNNSDEQKEEEEAEDVEEAEDDADDEEEDGDEEEAEDVEEAEDDADVEEASNDDEEGDEESENDNDDNEGGVESVNSNRDDKKQDSNVDDDASNTDTDNSTSSDEVISMDTETFNAHHNDVCDICDGGGELLLCGTCNLSFHIQCVRPKLYEMPSDRKWKCAYCILSSTPNNKKNNKVRKQAAIAVRVMAKLRKRIERDGGLLLLHDEDNDNNEINNNKDETETTTKSSNNNNTGSEKVNSDDKDVKIETGNDNDAKKEAETDCGKSKEDTSKEKDTDGKMDIDDKNVNEETNEIKKKEVMDDGMEKDQSRKKSPRNTRNKKDDEGKVEETDIIIEKPNKKLDDKDTMETDDKRKISKKKDEMEIDDSDKVETPTSKHDKGKEQESKEKDAVVTAESNDDGAKQSQSKNSNDAKDKNKNEQQEESGVMNTPKKRSSRHQVQESDGKPSRKDEGGDDDKDKDKDVNTNENDEKDAKESSKTDNDATNKKDSDAVKSDSDSGKKKGSTDTPQPPQFDVNEFLGLTPRSRRNRKQPVLYNPQAGPASRWTSDELVEWKMRQSEKEESGKGSSSNDIEKSTKGGNDNITDNKSSEKGSKSSSPKNKMDTETPEKEETTKNGDDDNNKPLSPRKIALKSVDTVWCNFCKDQPDVEICVFCGCRKCFGKHHQSKLLLCDQCDEEYHTFCLDPPLESVPKSKEWFCPTCILTRKADSASTTKSSKRIAARVTAETTPAPVEEESQSQSVVRRPKRTPSPKRAAADAAAAAVATSASTTSTKTPVSTAPQQEKKKSPTPPPPSEKKKKGSGRPRGRPPKTDEEEEQQQEEEVEEEQEADPQPEPEPEPEPTPVSVKKRGPGRPPASKSKSPAPPRKRGRPPSAATLAKRAKVEAAAKKAARKAGKKSAEAAASAAAAASSASAVAEPERTEVRPAPIKVTVTVSRSGRMVKRSSFHDEIAEGAQHLKSARYAEQMRLKAEGMGGSSSSAMGQQALQASYWDNTRAAAGGGATIQHVAHSYESTSEPMYGAEGAAGVVTFAPDTAMAAIEMDPMDVSAGHGSQVASLPTHSDSTDNNPGTDLYSVDAAMNQYDSYGGGDLAATAGSNVAMGTDEMVTEQSRAYRGGSRQPRRKPGARECMQISRRFGVKEIPKKYMDTLLDYCTRGKVEHLIRMRERLDEHSRFLELQLAGLEALVQEKGESDIVVPLAPPSPKRHDF